MKAVKRVGLEVVGWVMVLAGIAAMVLPGPGLLLLFGGVAVLSQQYEWAERRVDPLKFYALRAAAEGVETWPRIIMSSLGVLGLAAAGVLWAISPDVPGWWPLPDGLWLPGGWGTAFSLWISAIIAGALMVYSYRRFHGNPRAVEELEEELEEAKRVRAESREHADR